MNENPYSPPSNAEAASSERRTLGQIFWRGAGFAAAWTVLAFILVWLIEVSGVKLPRLLDTVIGVFTLPPLYSSTIISFMFLVGDSVASPAKFLLYGLPFGLPLNCLLGGLLAMAVAQVRRAWRKPRAAR